MGGRVHFRGADCGVPTHMRNGLRLYIEEGIMPSAFLVSILSNDLGAAAGRVDVDMQTEHIVPVSRWVFNHAPSKCWGSRAAVKAWVDRHHPEEKVLGGTHDQL